jgi:hypothetical protein
VERLPRRGAYGARRLGKWISAVIGRTLLNQGYLSGTGALKTDASNSRELRNLPLRPPAPGVTVQRTPSFTA